MDNIKPQIRRANENEVFLRDNVEWLHFTNPHRLVIAKTLDDVLPALQEMERLVQENNWYAAGFLSYEAASAFDPALETHASSTGLGEHSTLRSAREFPYLWFGLYPEPRSIALPSPTGKKEIFDWTPTTDCETYHSAIAKIKDHIANGRTYQVNFTMRMQAEFHGDAWEFFLHLVQSQNRHAAYIDTGRHIIVSASPELFFQLQE
ncbi:MAG TPA: chorismate-binding protein, partial [Anaerolineales bacterium]|nr:chorismate-binding protein [Anaerolineales bacterium]